MNRRNFIQRLLAATAAVAAIGPAAFKTQEGEGMSMVELWYVGQLKGDWIADSCIWEFQGVFDSEDKAVAACTTVAYFVSPITLNEELPSETMAADARAYYPKAEKETA